MGYSLFSWVSSNVIDLDPLLCFMHRRDQTYAQLTGDKTEAAHSDEKPQQGNRRFIKSLPNCAGPFLTIACPRGFHQASI